MCSQTHSDIVLAIAFKTVLKLTVLARNLTVHHPAGYHFQLFPLSYMLPLLTNITFDHN